VAGEQWARAKTMIFEPDVERLDAAAADWDTFAAVLQAVVEAAPPGQLMESAGLVGAVNQPLRQHAARAFGSVASVAQELARPQGPQVVLTELADYIRRVRQDMLDLERGGLLGFGALPDGRIPTTPAMQVARDLVLHEFDQQAAVYVANVQDSVSSAAELLGLRMWAFWPPGLPRLDPDAPGPGGG
jgi:hypothetical protein